MYKSTFDKLNDILDDAEKGVKKEKPEEVIDKSFKGFCKRNYGYIIAFFFCLAIFLSYVFYGRSTVPKSSFWDGLFSWIGTIWIIIMCAAVFLVAIIFYIKNRKSK